MRDRELYARILGVEAPWSVVDVDLDDDRKQVTVLVQHSGELSCPVCGKTAPGYDSNRRQWRHLDTCQYRTVLAADVPRVNCADHGVKQIAIPWAEGSSRFTALFECVVLDWLKEASMSAVGRRLALSWDEVDRIMQHAVSRGLARRANEAPQRLGVDETSFQKRHEYVTVVSDLDTAEVLHVSDDRTQGALEKYYESLSEKEIAKIEAVSMDMWQPYIAATHEHVPEAGRKIAFDKFHVARHLGEAVDAVRRLEHRERKSEGDDRLTGSKWLWLMNPASMRESTWRGRFKDLRDSVLRTARAWSLKEAAMNLWHYTTRGWALRAWRWWLGWAKRSRLDPMRKVAGLIEEHLQGIITATVLGATNAGAESINARIQRVKRLACGFRNRDRFRTAIYFHCGGLDLYPQLTHSKA